RNDQGGNNNGRNDNRRNDNGRNDNRRNDRDHSDNFRGGAGVAVATARIFDRATPGQYNLAVRCHDSNRIATRTFIVLSGRGARGGLGGSQGPSSTEMAVGGGLVATAAVGGAVYLLRRRRSMSGGEA
ncbi:hypothetical protein QMZ92_03000, partial [Streptomyces sp. HNM0645]|nr:hypothetical protein [Streptomyces sp. HNM0645]